MQKLAILATGDELVHGDIVNSNGPYLAQQLTQHNFVCGQHLTVSDLEADIIAALNYLLQDHRVIITMGGLGPTSDDRTRFAVAKVWQLPLQFYEESWQRIVNRSSRVTTTLSETNKQQAYFPEGATVIPNARGTADACEIIHGDQIIYMLPGPPKECFPIFDNYVLPRLQQIIATPPIYRQHWLLLGVAESELAERIDPLAEDGFTIGYRIVYPYVELKFSATDADLLQQKINQALPLIQLYLISDQGKKASAQLLETLANYHGVISIDDAATGGRLQATLVTPETSSKILFNRSVPAAHKIIISGMQAYWASQGIAATELHMQINQRHVQRTLRCYDADALWLAVEVICDELNKAIIKGECCETITNR